MQPILVNLQTPPPEPVTALSLSWLASWQGHIVAETAKAFTHVKAAVDKFFNPQARQIVTPITRLPSAVVAIGVARMLTRRDFIGCFDCLSHSDRVNLLKYEPHLSTKIVRAHKGDLDKIPTAWMRALQQAASTVRSLDLRDTALRPIHIKRIVQLFPNLKELNIENCSLTDQCIYYLRNTSIETLKFDKNAEITELGINWLSKLTELKTITLPPFTYGSGLIECFFEELLGTRAFWHAFPKTLENITVYCEKYPLSSNVKQFFSFLKAHCPNLTSITIPDEYNYRTQDIVDGLKAFTSLEKIVVNNLYKFTDAHLSALTALVHLKTLEIKNMWNQELTNAIFASLAKFKELEDLALTVLTGVTAEGIEALSTLPNFRSLTLATQALTNNGLNAIAKLKSLQKVDLSGSRFSERISPETLSALGAMPELHTLCITIQSRIPFFRHASGFVKLQKLKLNVFLSVQDVELTLLQKLPELIELEITRCEDLTALALTTLSGYKKLKKVKLTRSNFTAAAIANFKLARPDIELTN